MRDKGRVSGVIGIVLFVAAAVFSMDRAEESRSHSARLQENIAQEVFRFHVRANSDSGKDQEIKMAVRDSILDLIEREIGREATDEETRRWSRTHLEEIVAEAGRTIRREGGDYPARARVEKAYFPEKTYGDITFPRGEYDSLVVELGEGSGKNWWCVLYPGLCFADSSCQVVEDEEKAKLEKILGEDEYEMIISPSHYRIKWYFFGE